jgi:3-oxoacid CoA-transferase subunit A
MKFYVSGDTHGNFTRFRNLDDSETIGVIVLGDCAVNWTLDPEQDKGLKRQLTYKFPNIRWYLLRGNHDARPQNAPGMTEVYDEEVQGVVFREPQYPHINYFIDGGVYTINGHRVLTIGGAYSIDKYYRLMRGYIWHADEQLNQGERQSILNWAYGQYFDFVLTHTAPISWEPTDLFLPGLDQSNVDKTMELWLDKVKQSIHWKIWLFGHYHADRLERPGVQLMYNSIETLNEIYTRWTTPGRLEEEYWLPKSPMYYAEDK